MLEVQEDLVFELQKDYITEQEKISLINDCLEIKKILISTINTAKENQ